MIYHILPQTVYTALDKTEPYRAESLATEGFMHCTGAPELLVAVANRYYTQTNGPFVVLCIEEARVAADVRWEEAHGDLYPHIYGPLEWDAVEQVIDFPRTEDGRFLSPPELA